MYCIDTGAIAFMFNGGSSRGSTTQTQCQGQFIIATVQDHAFLCKPVVFAWHESELLCTHKDM